MTKLLSLFVLAALACWSQAPNPNAVSPLPQTMGGVFTDQSLAQANINFAILNARTSGATGAGVTIAVTNPPYNADNTGATNAAPAIQAAINAAPAGATVFVPRGSYLLSGSGTELILIPNTINFECEGSWGTTALVVAASVGSSTDVIHVHGPAIIGPRIHGCQIVAQSGTPARYGINLDATSAFDGQNLISNFEISNMFIEGLGSNAIATTFPAFSDGAFDGNIHDNFLNGGINLTRGGDTIRVQDNEITGAGPGVYADMVPGAVGPWVLNNVFTACSGSVVIVHGSSPKIIGNQLEAGGSCAGEANLAHIDVQGSFGSSVLSPIIEGNTITQLPGNPNLYGIRLGYTTSAKVEKNTGYDNASQTLISATANATATTLGVNEIYGPGSLLSSAEADIAFIMTSVSPAFTGQALAPAGTITAPSYSFSAETGLGFYRPSSNLINAAVAGIVGTQFQPIGIASLGFGIYNSTAPRAGGMNLAPTGSVAWNGDTNVSRVAAGVVAVGTGTDGSFAGTWRGAFQSSDGTAGMTASTGAAPTNCVVKNGLIVSCANITTITLSTTFPAGGASGAVPCFLCASGNVTPSGGAIGFSVAPTLASTTGGVFYGLYVRMITGAGVTGNGLALAGLYIDTPVNTGSGTWNNRYSIYSPDTDPSVLAGTLAVGAGATVIYRCTVAGTLRVGQLTSVAADCGTAVATSLLTN